MRYSHTLSLASDQHKGSHSMKIPSERHNYRRAKPTIHHWLIHKSLAMQIALNLEYYYEVKLL